MEVGKRIIFNPNTGTVLNNCLEAMSGELAEDIRPEIIDFIDLPFGDATLQDAETYHIDVVSKQVVVDSMIPLQGPTYEELEDQLLMMQEGLLV